MENVYDDFNRGCEEGNWIYVKNKKGKNYYLNYEFELFKPQNSIESYVDYIVLGVDGKELSRDRVWFRKKDRKFLDNPKELMHVVFGMEAALCKKVSHPLFLCIA